MKKLKLNAMALAALVVAAGTVAFTSPANQEWVFTGSSDSQIMDATHYSLSAPKPSNCADEASLPCSIVVAATNQSQLQTYLNGKDTDQILAEATGQRN